MHLAHGDGGEGVAPLAEQQHLARGRLELRGRVGLGVGVGVGLGFGLGLGSGVGVGLGLANPRPKQHRRIGGAVAEAVYGEERDGQWRRGRRVRRAGEALQRTW